MTAFASVSSKYDWGVATWELRSVNHRFLDINFRLPEQFSENELNFRKVIQKSLQRGKIDCYLTFCPGDAYMPKLQISTTLVKEILNQVEQIKEISSNVTPSIKPIDILKWPGVIAMQAQDVTTLVPNILDLLQQGIQQLVNMRQREGAELAQTIDSKLNEMLLLIEKAKPRVQESLTRQSQKIQTRLGELGPVDEERVAQEMVIFASKWDVEEELDRLQCHYQEVKACLKEGVPTGRRLDFLMQEMNREANTLASKSQDAVLSKIAVDLKVLIEQMREQIQNVE